MATEKRPSEKLLHLVILFSLKINLRKIPPGFISNISIWTMKEKEKKNSSWTQSLLAPRVTSDKF